MEFLTGPVWIPDLEADCDEEMGEGTMDGLGITYRGDFLECLFDTDEELFAG